MVLRIDIFVDNIEIKLCQPIVLSEVSSMDFVAKTCFVLVKGVFW